MFFDLKMVNVVLLTAVVSLFGLGAVLYYTYLRPLLLEVFEDVIFRSDSESPDDEPDLPEGLNVEKAIESLQEHVAEHEEKLREYMANPDAFDNKGILKNAPTEEIRQRIIDGRIRHLQHEINNWKEQIERLSNLKK